MLPVEHSLDRSSSYADDAGLFAALRKGDAAAFEFLVRRHGPRMLAVIRRYLGCEDSCHDVLQDAFLSAFRGLDRFSGAAGIATWLHKIAVNAALMKLRTQKRHPEIAIEDLSPKYLADGHRADPGSAWRMTADCELEAGERRRLVRESIDRLPEAYRTVLIMRDIDDLSTTETATLLETNEAVVKTRLHRARQALRELLDRHFGKGAL